MTNTMHTVPALRSDLAAQLLAEATYQGRSLAHGLRSMDEGREDMTQAQAAEHAGLARRAVDRLVERSGLRLAGADVGALYRAATAAMTRRLTGQD